MCESIYRIRLVLYSCKGLIFFIYIIFLNRLKVNTVTYIFFLSMALFLLSSDNFLSRWNSNQTCYMGSNNYYVM